VFLQNIHLKNFRNFQNENLNFHPRFNLIIGKNAQGKTNILEAIYYLSYLNSFRTSSKKDLIYYQNEECVLQAQFLKNGLSYNINHSLGKQKGLKLNGKKPKLYDEYLGLVPVLLFEPKDVYLFRDSPGTRRKFLNRAIFLQKPELVRLIRDYENIVQQKNRLLKESGFGDEHIEVWNDRLVTVGAKLMRERLDWICEVNGLLPTEYENVSGSDEKLTLVYKANVVCEKNDDEATLATRINQALSEKRNEERRRGEALVGPHRDDWQVCLYDRIVGDFGSQGENRSAIIALKSAQIHMFEKKFGEPPLFLLDDVASELDPTREKSLFEYLRSTQGQVFISTTEPAHVEPYFCGEGTSFLVEAGKGRVVVN